MIIRARCLNFVKKTTDKSLWTRLYLRTELSEAWNEPHLKRTLWKNWLDEIKAHDSTVNPVYTDIRNNDKTRYNDNLNGAITKLKIRWIIRDIQKYIILYSKKHMLWDFR